MIRLLLKVLLAPLIALMTIVTFVLGIVVVSFALAAFAVPVFICGMGKSGCLLLILAWFISPLGLPLIADFLWKGLDNLRGVLFRIVLR